MFLMTLGLLLPAMAQSADEQIFYFTALEEKLDESNINPEYVHKHFLGESVAKKLLLLSESYTWTEEGNSIDPATRTIIEKQPIYNSIKKVERYYKKGIRKGYIKEEVAREEFERILDIALYIRNQQTLEFEETLDALDSEEQIVSLFIKNVEINY